jgi:hypothetical protein
MKTNYPNTIPRKLKNYEDNRDHDRIGLLSVNKYMAYRENQET